MIDGKLTLGSLFDGSGGFPLGGLLAGVKPVWASEIEPYAVRVTTKRLPFMKHYGNVSEMDGGRVEPVDIITFGSPCQDMSVAGKRAGLDGSRSNLFYEAVRIIKEMRKATGGEYPKWACWENVPGAFSSSGGEDFRCVLESLCGICDESVSVPKPDKWANAGEIMGNGYSVAWRVFDAQYWGTPQRRKRIYLVTDLTGGRAGKVLFESEGLSGYSAEGFRAWQRTAADFETCTGTADGADDRLVLCDQGGNRMDVLEDKTATLRAEAHHPPIVMESAGFCTEHSAKSRSIGYEEETSPTLRAGVVPAAVALENHPADSRIRIEDGNSIQTLTRRCGSGGNNVPLLMEQKVYGVCSKASNAMKSDNPHSGFYEADSTRTLDANGGRPDCAQGGMVVVALQGSMIGRADKNGPQGSGVNEDVCFTLDGADRHAVAYGIGRDAFNQGKNAQYKPAIEEEVQPTLVAKGPGAVAEPTWSTSKASFFTMATEEKANTLVATDYKDPPIVNDEDGVHYIVRRLTPTECARLQGFPDWWCADLGTEHPTSEEIYEWYKVFETHRELVTHASKPKTEKQIIKWLKDPASDSAEYRLWGNGIYLGNAYFVLAGIVWADGLEKYEDEGKR